jgi:putative tryptophan/tyrosine transport system substrate-binding protein
VSPNVQRREFITLLGGAAATLPLGARAQQPAMPVVGVLDSVGDAIVLPAFRSGLSEMGYAVGRNVALDVRSTDQNDRLLALAKDLASSNVAVIAALGGPSAPAAKAATTTIPIVFSLGGDPVELGLVDSIARPGGNITGVTFFTAQLLQKQVGLMRELLPNARAFGVLVNPQNPRAVADLRAVQAAARSLGIEIHVGNATTKQDFMSAFASLRQKHIAALIIAGDPLVLRESSDLAALCSHNGIPAIMGAREFPQGGGLFGYGTNLAASYRQAGLYTGRILRGEKPKDLPVLQPTKFEFVINLKAAKTLGLEIPPTLLAVADEVIE